MKWGCGWPLEGAGGVVESNISAAAELNRAEEGEEAPVPLRGVHFAEEAGDGDGGGLPNVPDPLTFSLTDPRGLLREGRGLPALLPLLDGEPKLLRR